MIFFCWYTVRDNLFRVLNLWGARYFFFVLFFYLVDLIGFEASLSGVFFRGIRRVVAVGDTQPNVLWLSYIHVYELLFVHAGNDSFVS